MSSSEILNLLIAPHISEKSTILSDLNRQFVFKVARHATKPEIREAVEKAFDVKVDSISVLNVKPKIKRTGRVQGSRNGWKKAYVTLSDGYDIDYVGLK